MPDYNFNPIEELGLAKNAVARMLESYREQLPADELERLKWSYDDLDAVQQWFWDEK